MFAIAVPSTITLTTPPEKEGGEPVTYATLEFFHPTDDVSKCRLRLTTTDGDVHEATFNVGGEVVDHYYASVDDLKKAEEERKAQEAEIEAQREKERESAAAANARELKTADDTTAGDVSTDAHHATPVPPHVPPAPVNPQPDIDPQTGQARPAVYNTAKEPA